MAEQSHVQDEETGSHLDPWLKSMKQDRQSWKCNYGDSVLCQRQAQRGTVNCISFDMDDHPPQSEFSTEVQERSRRLWSEWVLPALQKWLRTSYSLLKCGRGFLLRSLAGLVIIFGCIFIYGAYSYHTLSRIGSPTQHGSQGVGRRLWGFSHNDELHGDRALTQALQLGFGGIEVDVWLPDPEATEQPEFRNSTPLVGHYFWDTKSNRTLQNVYLDPLMKMLDERNNFGIFGDEFTGLFPDEPHAELVLAIDIKGDGEAMWPYLIEVLDPFHSKGYLTTFKPVYNTWERGPIMVLGTGATPLNKVVAQSPRYIFYDAPLRQIVGEINTASDPSRPNFQVDFTNDISPIASDRFPFLYHMALFLPQYPLLNPYLSLIKLYANQARIKGIQPRWWGTARQPWFFRKKMWKMLKKSGYSWINGDDLNHLASWLGKWEAKRSRKEHR